MSRPVRSRAGRGAAKTRPVDRGQTRRLAWSSGAEPDNGDWQACAISNDCRRLTADRTPTLPSPMRKRARVGVGGQRSVVGGHDPASLSSSGQDVALSRLKQRFKSAKGHSASLLREGQPQSPGSKFKRRTPVLCFLYPVDWPEREERFDSAMPGAKLIPEVTRRDDEPYFFRAHQRIRIGPKRGIPNNQGTVSRCIIVQ